MSDSDFVKRLGEPKPFIRASTLAKLTPEGRRRLFLSLYQEKHDPNSDIGKAELNSTYGQMMWVKDDS